MVLNGAETGSLLLRANNRHCTAGVNTHLHKRLTASPRSNRERMCAKNSLISIELTSDTTELC